MPGRQAGSGRSPARCPAASPLPAGPGAAGAEPNSASRLASTKTGPRCGAAAIRNASSTAGPTRAVSCSVQARLVIACSSAGWSISCRLPEPQRESGARPPITTSGDALKCAVVIALTPLVTPGPAVSTANPGARVSRAVPSAANTAVCSCLTSTIRMGGSALTAPS